MKSLCFILAVAIVQGVIGQQDTFEVEPNALNIKAKGEEVVLECRTRESVTCAWKLNVPGLPDGFLNFQAAFLDKDGIRVRDPQANTNDCTIIIDQVEMKHSGNYTCSPYVSGGQVDATPAKVIVAVKPASVAFTGDLAFATELTANTIEEVSVTCEARDARPEAELQWFLGDRELTDGVVADDPVTDQATKLITSRLTLTHQFMRQDEGAMLRCQAKHPAYAEGDETEATLGVMVQFAPERAEGSDLGTLYGFSEGEDKDVTVNFTSNPAPTEILWTVGPDMIAAGQQSEDGHIIAGPLEEVNAEAHQYAVRLTFSPVRSEDQNTTFRLELGNALGQQELSLRVGAGAPPPPPAAAPKPASEGNGELPEAAGGTGSSNNGAENGGVSGAAIGGIIVGVIVLLALIALVAFARSRGKWCFAAKPSDAGAEASDTESAHDEKTDKPEGKGFKLSNLYSSLMTKKKEGDVESAVNKDETKELTGPDGESSPKREQPEVVYAELVLDKDGVKTEVRPSPEKTEYAVIVGVKTPEAKE